MEEEHRPFVSDMHELRRRAKGHMEMGAMTRGYTSERETVVRILNEVLATELVCVQRYKRHYLMAVGIHETAAAVEFLAHSDEEQQHANIAAERIRNLGGEPNFHPEGLATRRRSQYAESSALVEMVREDLIAERIAVESYREIIRFLGDNDPTTRRAMEEIMAKEVEHTEDMQRMLEAISVNGRFAQRV